MSRWTYLAIADVYANYSILFKKAKSFNHTAYISNSYNHFSSHFSAINFDFINDSKVYQPEIILKDASQLKNIISDIYKDNTKLLLIDPRKFEELIAELLLSQGFEVELTKQTRDNG